MAPSLPQQHEVLLSVHNLSRTVDNQQSTGQKTTVWRGISFDVCRGDIMFLRGPSGVGKTLLLRTLACLDPVEGGLMQLLGKSPSEVGIPCWRAQVMYVHQQRVSYPGTPTQLFERIQGFAAQKARGPAGPGSVADLGQLVEQLGLDRGVLAQQWAQLSGGQAQRVSLAISIALRPQVLLLDEPTSACDMDATLRVEAVLRQVATSAAVVWVTHDEQQPTRVGGKVLTLPAGVISSTDGTPEQHQHSHQAQPDHHAVVIPPEASHAPAPQAAWRDPATAVRA